MFKILTTAALILSPLATPIMAAADDFALLRNSETMLSIMSEISENYVDTVDTDELMKDISTGISAYLDPYSNYIAYSDISDFETMTTGKYGGIGALIRQRGEEIIISRPYHLSPADRAGLVVGDKIVAIDDKPIAGMTTSEASEMLKGVPGSKVKITIEGLVSGKVQNKILRRESITIPSIPYAGMIDDKVGYIQHSDFTEGCSYDMRRAVLKLKKQGMRSLVLDYRNNGGGIMQEAIKILSLFLPKGTDVLEVKSRRDSTTYYTEQEPIAEDIALTVLINSNSASASEIVAGALQDLDRALLVGQRSYGKGLVQTPRPVGYGSYLMLTTARYYIPSGRCIQAINYNQKETLAGKIKPVADSLRRTFYTKRDRKVLDGGGITPDIRMTTEGMGRFATTLYGRGYIEDFGNEYYRINSKKIPDMESFTLSEQEYKSFCDMIDSCAFEYESSSRAMLTKLRRTLESEHINGLESEMEAIEAALSDDLHSNLERYSEQITTLIEHDIIARYHYTWGGIHFSLGGDKEIEQAVELLRDRQQYNKLIMGVN